MAYNYNQSLMCVDLPPNIHSPGLWGNTNQSSDFRTPAGLMVHKAHNTLPTLEKQMALTFFTAQFFHIILNCFGIPIFVSQMLAGFVLGPSVLMNFKYTWEKYSVWMFSLTSQEILANFTMFGYSMFLFLMGVKMDPGLVFKTGRKAIYTGVSSLVVPAIVGLSLVAGLIYPKDDRNGLYYLAVAISQTSFPVIAVLLGDLQLMTTELGRLGISAALVCDMFGLCFTTAARMVLLFKNEGSPLNIVQNLVVFWGFVLWVVCLARPAMNWVIRQTPKGKPVHGSYIFVVLLFAMISGFHSQLNFFGPFFFGLAVPSGPPLGSTLVQKYEFMVSHVFMPLFVTACVLMGDLREIQASNIITSGTGLVLVATMVTKFGGTLVPALLCKIPVRDAFALAFIMSCKGAVELAGFFVSNDGKTFNDSLYAVGLLYILFTQIAVTMGVKYLYNPSMKYSGYQQRNVMSIRPNSELKILSCIHRHDNVATVINLLDATCPTRDNPLTLYVLHLIEMSGQAAPMFVSHRLQTKTISEVTYSEDVLVSFLNFERDYSDAVSVHPFTAVCPSNFMYEQITTMALDVSTSLIILPFHRHWTMHGAVKSEDQNVRNLNISVLEGSPCSVGILVNRGSLRQHGGQQQQQQQQQQQSQQHSGSTLSDLTQYRVAVIFLGGEDDREALALAQRMATDPSVHLSVFHISPPRENESNPGWNRILDMESLRKFRQSYIGSGGGYAVYAEEVSESGPETVDMLREIVHKFDLFVVGRRKNMDCPQTSGLDDWSEFPELGVIGDMLASDDLCCRSSILVVQQQRTIANEIRG